LEELSCFELDKVFVEDVFSKPNFRLADAPRDPVCSANLHSVRARAERGSAGREQRGHAPMRFTALQTWGAKGIP